jgi:serine/threonine-protein kinase
MLVPTPTHGTAVRDSFLATALAADLIAPAQLVRAEAAVPADAQTPADAARALVSAGLLTNFQAERLVAGRTDGFHLGPYVIQDEIGRGAAGRVYRAKHRTMNRQVAIKVLASELTRTTAARQAFRREARAAAQLNHPNLVTAYDANEHAGRFYLVLELVDGPDLEALVRERGPLPVAEACDLIRQAAAGLDHAHARGLVHGAIKPANLHVSRPSRSVPESVVKIVDFGIAGLQPPSGNTPLPDGLVGAADYVAPEQARDPRTADHRADLYSLGAVMYFLLTGRPPFPGGAAKQKVRGHLTGEPGRIERVRPDVPPPVAALLHQLLAKRPDARPASAAEVVVRLEGRGAVGEAVCFDLPTQSGQHSFASRPTSCGYPIPAIEPAVVPAGASSPWEQITTPTEGSLELTPVITRGARPVVQPTARVRTKGVPAWRLGLLALGILMTCMTAIALLVRTMGR